MKDLHTIIIARRKTQKKLSSAITETLMISVHETFSSHFRCVIDRACECINKPTRVYKASNYNFLT